MTAAKERLPLDGRWGAKTSRRHAGAANAGWQLAPEPPVAQSAWKRRPREGQGAAQQGRVRPGSHGPLGPDVPAMPAGAFHGGRLPPRPAHPPQPLSPKGKPDTSSSRLILQPPTLLGIPRPAVRCLGAADEDGGDVRWPVYWCPSPSLAGPASPGDAHAEESACHVWGEMSPSQVFCYYTHMCVRYGVCKVDYTWTRDERWKRILSLILSLKISATNESSTS